MPIKSMEVPKVYTAGRAIRLLEGTDIQSAWEMYTFVFEVENNQRFKRQSFVYGGYPLEEKVRGSQVGTQRNDVFKSTTSTGSTFFTEVTEWNPVKKFTFIEYSWLTGAIEPTAPNRTDFTFASHPEGTMIEIVRREKSLLKDARDAKGSKKMIASNAAGRLGHIIGGSAEGFFLKDGQSIELQGYVVSRRDDLMLEFSDSPTSGNQ